MRATNAALGVALIGLAATAPGASAVITSPDLTLPAFTKAEPTMGTNVSATFNWGAAAFAPSTPFDRLDVTAQPDGGGVPTTVTLAASAVTVPLLLVDGNRYTVTVAACQGFFACALLPSSQVAASSGVTRIDGTPPSGTVQIDANANFTADTDVTLNLAATDPLIAGIADSSSGVPEMALDLDGDGTFACTGLILIGGTNDRSGCARPFTSSLAIALPPGDGVKTIGVTFGDGARAVRAPCPTIFCRFLFSGAILGNTSPAVTDTIVLDTVKPVAVATQDRFAIERGGTVTFDAAASLDQSPVVSSGVDLAGSSWDFKDQTPAVTGQQVPHTFTQVGTFVGELRVKDRAGNVSDPRPFSVTVTSPSAQTTGGATVGVVTGQETGTFKLDRIRVSGRYVKSVLKGSISLEGTAAAAGPIRLELTRRGSAKRALSTTVPAGAFAASVKLPGNLPPGRYAVALVGPGGTLATTLKLTAPREGVVAPPTVTFANGRATARFRFLVSPKPAQRKKLRVIFLQGGRSVGTVKLVFARRLTARAFGLDADGGRVTARLAAGRKVIGQARST